MNQIGKKATYLKDLEEQVSIIWSFLCYPLENSIVTRVCLSSEEKHLPPVIEYEKRLYIPLISIESGMCQLSTVDTYQTVL